MCLNLSLTITTHHKIQDLKEQRKHFLIFKALTPASIVVIFTLLELLKQLNNYQDTWVRYLATIN